MPTTSGAIEQSDIDAGPAPLADRVFDELPPRLRYSAFKIAAANDADVTFTDADAPHRFKVVRDPLARDMPVDPVPVATRPCAFRWICELIG